LSATDVEMASAAIDHGLPVVVDKPLAVSSARAEQLVARAQRAGVLLTVFLGALAGSVIFLPLQLLGKKRLVPFGVFLAVGGAVTFLFRDSILSWYVQFLHGA